MGVFIPGPRPAQVRRPCIAAQQRHSVDEAYTLHMNRAHTYKMERFGSGASKKRGGLGWREAVLGGGRPRQVWAPNSGFMEDFSKMLGGSSWMCFWSRREGNVGSHRTPAVAPERFEGAVFFVFTYFYCCFFSRTLLICILRRSSLQKCHGEINIDRLNCFDFLFVARLCPTLLNTLYRHSPRPCPTAWCHSPTGPLFFRWSLKAL